MDVEKGLLLTWVAEIFIRRGAHNDLDSKAWLPDLPHLSEVLLHSGNYMWSDECFVEVQLLGMAADYSFAEFMSSLNSPLSRRGSCAAYPITFEECSEDTSGNLSRPSSTRVFMTNALPSDGELDAVGDAGTRVADAMAEHAMDDMALLNLGAGAPDDSSGRSEGLEHSPRSGSTESESCSGPLFGEKTVCCCSESTDSDVTMYSPPRPL